jgi:hypothetical protein
MFGKESTRSLSTHSGSTTFQKRIAPKIAAHIQKPIVVRITGEDTGLTAWLIENLSTISPLQISLSARAGQRPGQCYRKRAKYE